MSRSSRSSQRNGNTVDMEVSNLFSLKDKTQYTNALLALRRKYKDEELVNKIQELFIKRHGSVIKGAKKFADAIRKRYGDSNIPFHQLLGKARAHANKHDLSENEFAEFQRTYEQELAGTSRFNEVVIPITNLMKVLGNITFGQNDHFNITEDDYKYLQEILKLYEMSKPIHAQTLLQSLQYTDLALQATSGRIDRSKHNPSEHVHPVVAAMFLPKIDLFESHFLYANISNIVKSRYNKEPLTTRPDYELFYNLVTDPNDVVCDSRAPVADLLNRCHLQNHLWNAVLHLRNGQDYNSSFREFITAVDVCRLNKYDNPDFVYGRYDGTILKRILSAFSFRPTTVATLPMTNVFATNPYSQNVRPTVTSIPMINVRLHSYQNITTRTLGSITGIAAPGPISLKGCLTQAQPFIEGNMLVQRISDVIYSREVLLFYIDRRAYLLDGAMPFNLSRLPTAIAGFERINKFPVELDIKMPIRQTTSNSDVFCLRSVVVAETNAAISTGTTTATDLVVGSSTYIYEYDSPMSKSSFTPDRLLHYNPGNAFNQNDYVMYDAFTSGTTSGIPIAGGNSQVEAEKAIKEQGIIFIYQNFKFKSSDERMLAL